MFPGSICLMSPHPLASSSSSLSSSPFWLMLCFLLSVLLLLSPGVQGQGTVIPTTNVLLFQDMYSGKCPENWGRTLPEACCSQEECSNILSESGRFTTARRFLERWGEGWCLGRAHTCSLWIFQRFSRCLLMSAHSDIFRRSSGKCSYLSARLKAAYINYTAGDYGADVVRHGNGVLKKHLVNFGGKYH